ncbi:MAG: glycosyltransferase [Lewinellaceae bacterium]|nr:glycosyltransferase [Lewinellaceae bacterium]
MSARPRILVAPLDWGLGHATRCVPVIRELQRQGAEPVLATAGRAAAYLQAEFPGLELIEFPAYDIRYPTGSMYWNIGIQSRKLLRAVKQEHRQLQSIIRRLGIKAVISDNRFGCFSQQAPCVFVTHQINIPLPLGPAQWAANHANHFFIRKFRACWIPDHKPEGLSGALSRPFPGLRYHYLGILSRFSPLQLPWKYDVLALLSGPEPQRSRLEHALTTQLQAMDLQVLLVQGKTESYQEFDAAPNIRVVSFLGTAGLHGALASSEFVICRSGYSTLMDLFAMGKKALLIPTPGQPEQEYLAKNLQVQGVFPFQTHSTIDLAKGLSAAEEYTGFPKSGRTGEGLEAAIGALLQWV